MEPTKPSHLRGLLGRTLLFGLVLFAVRFAYVLSFFFLPKTLNNLASVSSFAVNNALESSSGENGIYTSKDWINSVHFYSSVFNDLVSDGFLSPKSRSLCVETPAGQDVFALREIGVLNSIGVSKKASKPLVVSYKKGSEKGRLVLPFRGGMFDFVFSGGAHFDDVSQPLDLALEIVRTMKPGGVLVVHVKARDEYSFTSFLGLFNSCRLVRSRDLEGYGVSSPNVMKEIVLRKESGGGGGGGGGGSGEVCSVPVYKRELVRKAEPLIMEEPLKPWITLKRNIGNIKYLTSMADISFKNRYVYVDVGARSYGSSIGSWFKKQYPKQNRTFSVYAIEADKTFHAEYAAKKGVTLLPYAAWVRNETLSFEISSDPGQEKGRGMGRIRGVKSLSGGGSFDGEVDEIEGFDFAEWLKRTVTDKDFVVMKMDVEGTEFELIPRLFKTGAMCLIDEIFLECHYNRWQRCCPGERSSKYEKTYGQCLELFTSLRNSGVLVHQWW